ncbi:SirB1 family protein [Enterovibrio calviensis]|uniref:SirB1 family protein n=1 Tax=Enterovibrio calviensis TaxID=91359 RepID=UPI00048A4136|nr:tetratricopeptide repeat protein [Enterovibrio calviensis]
MIAFTDQELDALTMVEGALALNAAVDPATSMHWVRAELEQLAKDAEHLLASETNDELRLEGLIRLFYKDWGFKGDFEQYFSSDNTFVEKVLKRRKGIPVSLGAIFLFFADRLDLPLEPVGFPTQLILKVDWFDREPQYINPFDGEFLSPRILRGWLVGKEGSTAQLLPEHLEGSDNPTLIGRWLAVIKSALLREENYSMALRCSELALTFSPDDPYEIRDRGYIFQQLKCDWVAAEDYEYFIAQCPHDPAAELLKLQVKVLTAEAPIFH